MSITNRLLAIQEKIDNAERERHRLEGALAGQMKMLKTEHGCSSVQEAKTKLQELRRSAKILARKTAAEIKELERRLGGSAT